VTGEAVSVDTVGATEFPKAMAEIIRMTITYHSRFSVSMKLNYGGKKGQIIVK
jgi:hypothetical protein